MQKKSLHNTLILVFAHTAEQDALHKGLSSNISLFRELNSRILHQVQQTKMSYWLCNTREQKGDSFGERLAYALQAAFNKGYSKILVVGNDCPQLSANHLIRSAAILETGKTVLGPDYRQGFYLIGIHQDAFDYDAWAALPWQKAELGTALPIHLQKQGEITFLSPLRDLNTPWDAQKLLSKPLGIHRKLFTQLLIWCGTTISPPKKRGLDGPYTIPYFQSPYNKGSPLRA